MKQINPLVPVIMVTGAQDPDVVVQAALFGSSAFVTKPLDIGDLIFKTSIP